MEQAFIVVKTVKTTGTHLVLFMEKALADFSLSPKEREQAKKIKLPWGEHNSCFEGYNNYIDSHSGRLYYALSKHAPTRRQQINILAHCVSFIVLVSNIPARYMPPFAPRGIAKDRRNFYDVTSVYCQEKRKMMMMPARTLKRRRGTKSVFDV